MRTPDGLRPVRDDDAGALIALIQAAYAEHLGCVLDLPGVDADLAAPATTAARRGGRWWVVERDGRLVATVGTGPLDDDGSLELKRLYVDRAERREGLATALVGWVEAHAGGLGAREVQLWSDTRFAAAHRLYTTRGYGATGEERDLHDPSHTTEWRFVRNVARVPPRRVVTWDGPDGHDTCYLTDLPDGALLAGGVGEVTYRVEVDAAWRTRTTEVTDATGRRRLRTDGEGRWWRDGEDAPELTGCVDVDIEATPATNTLPIRRAADGVDVGDTVEVRAAWVRVPGPDVVASQQRYRRTAPGAWWYGGSGGWPLTVDGDGLVEAYGDLWTRV